MVNHDQKEIKASERGKVGHEVTRDLLEGAGCGGVNGGKWGNGRVSSFVSKLCNLRRICRHKRPGQATKIQPQ